MPESKYRFKCTGNPWSKDWVVNEEYTDLDDVLSAAKSHLGSCEAKIEIEVVRP